MEYVTSEPPQEESLRGCQFQDVLNDNNGINDSNSNRQQQQLPQCATGNLQSQLPAAAGSSSGLPRSENGSSGNQHTDNIGPPPAAATSLPSENVTPEEVETMYLDLVTEDYNTMMAR